MIFIYFSWKDRLIENFVLISESNILIGQPVVVEYEARFENEVPFEFTPFDTILPALLKDSTGAYIPGIELELIEPFSYANPEKNVWVGTYRFVCWDSALVLIPGPEIKINGISTKFDNGKWLWLICDIIKKRASAFALTLWFNWLRLLGSNQRPSD